MKIEEIINRRELAERLDNDMDLFRELAELFIEDSPKLMGNIQNAINENDPDKLRKYAHTIKGSISNFSAQSAFDVAYELEMIGRNREMEKAEETFGLLSSRIDEAREAMKLLMKEESL